MPDIYDPERGLKIGLTDEDYENYQNGNLSDDFYARRTDGSIANRVTISPLDDDNDEDGEPSGGIDPGSAVIGALIMATIAGATYGIKKLWDRHKAKKAETQVNVRKEEGTQLSTETACEVLSTETAKSNDAEPKSLTQEEAIQELMKILVGMAEIAAGKKKVSEGVENLSNAGIVDRMVLLKKLSDVCSIIKGIELGLFPHIMSRQNWHKNMIVLFIMLYIINPYLIRTFKTMNKHYR